MNCFDIGPYRISVAGEQGGFTASLNGSELTKGVWVVTLDLISPTPAVPASDLRIVWRIPVIDMIGIWHSEAKTSRVLSMDNLARHKSRATINAPVMCAFSDTGRNRLTFACSDALHCVESRMFVAGHAQLECHLYPFRESRQPATRFTVELRIDARDIPFQDALADVTRWWESHPGYTPAPVPEHARLPMYSTWYSFLQKLDRNAILRQCELAKSIGCESIIVDDGWQPVGDTMGYRYCGDWEPANVGDMPSFVRGCQDRGLKFLLWYGTPLIGHDTKAYARHKHQMLYDLGWTPCAVLDPRYPEIRQSLIGKLEQGTRDWGLDGLKLDFVDLWVPPANEYPGTDPAGRDFADVPEAADHLLTQIMQRLRSIRPEIMIEFRQWYIGPLMRKYGNMLRAADCPDCAASNRMRTIDIRLLSGNTPAHCDMLEWHAGNRTEIAAMQLLHAIFSVPQISVLLDAIPQEHVEMLRFWLGFWRENRDVLLDGRLEPLLPQWLYPVIRSSTADKRVVAVYADIVADLGDHLPPKLMLINGTLRNSIVVESDRDQPARRLRLFGPTGQCVHEQSMRLSAGIQRIAIPPAGLAVLETV